MVAVEIDGQHLADGRALVAALGERVRCPPSIKRPPPRWLTNFCSERQLVLREERRLDVVQDHRVIAVQVLGVLGKAALAARPSRPRSAARGAAPAGRTARPWSSFWLLKPRNSGLVRSPLPAQERELGLLLGDPHQAHQLHLVVLGDGPAEELEFPVGPAGDVEHAVRPAAAIDRRQAAVVGQRGLGGAAAAWRSKPSSPSRNACTV